MGGKVVLTTRESGPLRGNSVVYVTYKKSSLNTEVKLLTAEKLYITAYNYNYNNNILQ
jgi:hypothetical protein